MSTCRFCPREATTDDVCRYHAAGRVTADQARQASSQLDAYAAEYVYEPDTGYVRGPSAAKVFAAVRDVLDDHVPKWPGTHCRADDFTWPCMTVKLITAALEDARPATVSRSEQKP